MSDQQTVQPPPPGPPGAADASGEDPLVRRVERLEDGQLDTRERLARLETRLEDVAVQMATKADLAALEAKMLKWHIGTTIALTGIVFAAARLIK